MLIRMQTTNLLQIFCELLLYSQVICKSMRVPDDTFWRRSKCEWVKVLLYSVAPLVFLKWAADARLSSTGSFLF